MSAPLLQPDFPGRSVAAPGSEPLQGRELYRRAVHAQLAIDKAAGGGLNNRMQRWTPVQKNKSIDAKWHAMPSPIRRRWEAESHRLWPRPWADVNVMMTPFNVYATDDEIYQYRKNAAQPATKSRWHLSEAEIRNRYLPHFNALPGGQSAAFQTEADKINDAQGLQLLPNMPQFQPTPNNGSIAKIPSGTKQLADIQHLPNPLGQLTWRFHKELGTGAGGTAMVYRAVGDTGLTLRTIVVKRDVPHSNENAERHYLNRVQNLPNKSQHIVTYIGGYSPIPPIVPGVTYLELAPHGDLFELFAYYLVQRALLPEPFCWYLLHALADACLNLEQGLTADTLHTRPPPPGWRPLLHMDIKPPNILLDAPNINGPGAQHWHSVYPRPIVTDFGAVKEYPAAGAADQIPLNLKGLATRGRSSQQWIKWRPTSHAKKDLTVARKPARSRRKPFEEPLPENQKIRIHTSIYQVGLVLWVGMSKHPQPGWVHQLWRARSAVPAPNMPWQPAWEDFHPRHTSRNIQNNQRLHLPEHALRPHYSARLVELVYRCMHPVVGERPTPAKLAAETRLAMDDIQRHFPPPPPGPPPHIAAVPRSLVVRPDKYPLNVGVLNDVYIP